MADDEPTQETTDPKSGDAPEKVTFNLRPRGQQNHAFIQRRMGSSNTTEAIHDGLEIAAQFLRLLDEGAEVTLPGATPDEPRRKVVIIFT